MTIKNKKMQKTSMLVGITAIILTLTVISPSIAQDIFAVQTDGGATQNVVLDQRLADAHQILTQKMINRNVSDIPLVLSYVDPQTSTLIVGIDSDAPLSQVVYHERLLATVGNVPMKILSGKFVRDACASQTSDCTPLWGGIQVQSRSPFGSTGTLTLPAQTLSGKLGFIMSGHVAGNGITGQTVGQATTRTVGTVITNPVLTSRLSDSAFVELSAGMTTENKIWKSSTSYFTVTGKATSSTTPVGTAVQMQGITSHLTSGFIQGKGLTVFDATGTLSGQVAASYTSASGDSGAPIFSSGTTSVTFYGIHVGKFCIVEGGHPPCIDPLNTVTIYSPWEGIKGELLLV